MSPTFWALIALIVFFVIIIYMKVPSKLGQALEDRSDKIREELEEARRLREEAQAILADYERKRAAANEEAQAIIDQAKIEAKRMEKETKEALEELIERRSSASELKIKQAEQKAVLEIRQKVTNVAAQAAQTIISETMDKTKATKILDQSIDEISKNFH